MKRLGSILVIKRKLVSPEERVETKVNEIMQRQIGSDAEQYKFDLNLPYITPRIFKKAPKQPSYSKFIESFLNSPRVSPYEIAPQSGPVESSSAQLGTDGKLTVCAEDQRGSAQPNERPWEF